MKQLENEMKRVKIFDGLVSIKKLENEIKAEQHKIQVRYTIHIVSICLFLPKGASFLVLLGTYVSIQNMYEYFQDTIKHYCANATSILDQHWKDLNGDEIINDLESKWTQWKVKDTVQWFEYVLSLKYDKNDGDDYQIEDLSESDDESDDDNVTDKDGGDEKLDPSLSN